MPIHVVQFRPLESGTTEWVCPLCKTRGKGPRYGKNDNLFKVMNAVFNHHSRLQCASCRLALHLVPGKLPELLSPDDKDWGFYYQELIPGTPPEVSG